MLAIAWGTFPDLVAAVGTLGAFGVGGWLLVKELRVQRARDEDARREQASKVAAWILLDRPYGVSMANVPYRLFVRNGSDQPVYEFHVSNPNGEYKLRVLPPETEREESLRFTDQAVVALESTNREQQAITLTFRDANGRQWRRGPDGVLESFESEP